MAILVVPAYNEEANLPRLLADLEARPALWGDGGRLVLVDDGSTDRTGTLARAHDGAMPVDVLTLAHNAGPGRAFDAGFRRALQDAAEDELIVTLESDTTSDLDALDAMLVMARGGADVVLASHHGQGALLGVAAHRRFLSRAASFAIRRGAGVDATTVSSFFRVYRAAMLREAYARHGDGLIRESGFACMAEVLMKLTRMGARVAEVPVSLDWSRREGESKLRVLPTMAGYTRLMLRQVAPRGWVR